MTKNNYMVTLTSTITKTETWLIENETKEDAIYIAENQNMNPQYKCTKWNESESDPEFEEEVIVKEVSFELDEAGSYAQGGDGKGYWKEVEEKKEEPPTLENAKTRLEQMSRLKYDPITD